LGGALATIKDGDLDNAITRNMPGDTWIGLNDPNESKTWEWYEDSSALGTYDNWFGNNPGVDARQRCVLKKFMHELHGGWSDVLCNEDIPYACTMASTCAAVP
jgi:hypothetical protein